MKRYAEVVARNRKLLLSAAGLAAVTSAMVFGMAGATPLGAQTFQGARKVVQLAAQQFSQLGAQLQNTIAAATDDFKFEVASIRPNKTSGAGHNSSHSGVDEFRATNITTMQLIRQAFGFPLGPGTDDGRILGGPSWLDSEGYDIDAKAERSVVDALNKLSPEERVVARQRMLQALLAERFGLIVHRESKELPIYSMTIAKNGPKLHEAKPDDAYDNGAKLPNGLPAGSGFHSSKRGEVTAQGVSIPELAGWLSRQVGRTILDNTGLTAKYDLTLNWTPDNAETSAESSGVSIFVALQQQLGLKLESGKGPVEVIVIDHVDRPSAN
jgi:uncharacterized protein (TIGR03435 family)